MTFDIMKVLHEIGQFHSPIGADNGQMPDLQRTYGVLLPRSHQEILRSSNGLEAYGGYLRLFGLRSHESIDSMVWNDSEYWRFAWGERCAGYWFFAETAFGDQWAYSLNSLRDGIEEVYFLDALSMAAKVISSSFEEFLHTAFVRLGHDDPMIQAARHVYRHLSVTSHLVYNPSLLLGGREEVGSLQVMNARSAMICNGDLALQFDAAPPNTVVEAVVPYEDSVGRMRLRVVWR